MQQAFLEQSYGYFDILMFYFTILFMFTGGFSERTLVFRTASLQSGFDTAQICYQPKWQTDFEWYPPNQLIYQPTLHIYWNIPIFYPPKWPTYFEFHPPRQNYTRIYWRKGGRYVTPCLQCISSLKGNTFMITNVTVPIAFENRCAFFYGTSVYLLKKRCRIIARSFCKVCFLSM